MKAIKVIFPVAFAVTSALVAPLSYSQPVQFDTADAHVTVIRPADIWSPSSQSTENIVSRYQLKQVRYRLTNEGGSTNSDQDDELARKVKELVKPLGFEVGGFRSLILVIEKPVTLTAEQMPAFLATQDLAFKQTVARAGNPANLASQNRRQQWIAGAFGLVVAGLGVNSFGSVAVQAAQGPAQDAYSVVMRAKQVLTPQPSVPFDYSGYTSVDIRRVKIDDHIGQIIIAYRGEKTESKEVDALSRAIVTASGADSTLDDIQAAQTKDQANRQAVWDACVASGACNNQE